MLDTKQQYKQRKIITELRGIKGRHTELVSVYIPAGYDLNKVIQHLAEEQGTASNIKDKTTRLNVQDSLDKMIRHLRLYTRLPENGLAAFSGNTASQEGKQDLKVWSVEPPVPLGIRMYRCDQTFVLEPLENMLHVNEIYGLLVMDNREATIGFLKGKAIQVSRDFSSSVPGKVKVGGWCLDPDTLVSVNYNKVKKLSEIKIGDSLLSYSIKTGKLINSKCKNIWRTNKFKFEVEYGGINLGMLTVGKKNIICSLDHLFYTFIESKIKEIPASSLKYGDLLIGKNSKQIKVLAVSTYKNKIDMIDIETTAGNFFANGILVHNSQQRYARLREAAANEFYKRIADVLNVEFASVGKELKGILIGGPGPTKETFASGAYIHTELKKKVLAVKDIAYTDEQGLHELVDKAQDVLAEAEISKEKKILNEFFTLLSTNSDKVSYGSNDVMKALDYGAVDKLLLSEAFSKIEEYEEKANSMGTNVFIISIETKEGVQLKELGGVGAILRYAIKDF